MKMLLAIAPPFWPKMPSIGIGCLQAFLEKNNIPCDIIDLNNIFYNLSSGELKKSWLISCNASLENNIFGLMRKNHPEELKNKLEQKSPSYKLRYWAINKLLDENIGVVPYFSPILPWLSDFKDIFSMFPGSNSVEFEGLNMNLININDIISEITSVKPDLQDKYGRLLKDNAFYHAFWQSAKKDIIREAIKAKKNYNIHIHSFRAYFNNKYAPTS